MALDMTDPEAFFGGDDDDLLLGDEEIESSELGCACPCCGSMYDEYEYGDDYDYDEYDPYDSGLDGVYAD